MFDLIGFITLCVCMYIAKSILKKFINDEVLSSLCFLGMITTIPIAIYMIYHGSDFGYLGKLIAYIMFFSIWGVGGFPTSIFGYKIGETKEEKVVLGE